MKDILELDVASYATAIGHGAALRLAQVLGPDFDPNFWFCDGGFAYEVDGEAMVAALGAYVVERTARGGVVGAEQLFIKAHELGAHRHPNDRFPDLDLWVRVAYAVFASVTTLCARELGQAQERARDEETKLRAAPAAEGMNTLQIAATADMIKTLTSSPAAVEAVVGDDAGLVSSPDGELAVAVLEGSDAPSNTINAGVYSMDYHDAAQSKIGGGMANDIVAPLAMSKKHKR
jgi:hypothetical protein